MLATTLALSSLGNADEQPIAPLFDAYTSLVTDTRIIAEDNLSTLTIFAPALLVSQVVAICVALQEFAIIAPLQRHALSGRWDETVITAEIAVRDVEGLHSALARVAEHYRVDVCVQSARPSLHTPGLLVMDMDSTVIQIECIDEIAKLAGVGEQVAGVTARAMRGELAFRESLLSRVACLSGVEVAKLLQIKQAMPLMPGVATLVSMLRDKGWYCTIASGGFTYFADYLQQRLLLDDTRANRLEVIETRLTGRVLGTIVDAEYKATSLREWQNKYGIVDEQTIAMGDGANDLAMMKAAGLGVACHAKPIVNAAADVAIRFSSLHALLYLMDA